VAAITGASAGIGEACALALASRGVAVALGARRADRLEAVAARIRAQEGRAVTIGGDVTDPGHLEALVSSAIQSFGRLDIMICNAGIGFHGAVEETSREVMERLMDVNFMGTFHAVKAALPRFRRQASGHVVIVSSIVGQRGIGFMSAYSATKAAQIGFAEGLRAELQGTGIHVSVVCPVSTLTEFHEAMRRDFGHAVSGLGPRQTAEDVARAVVACIGHPRAEVYPHAKSRGLVVLNAIAPGFTDRLVQKYGRRRRPADPRA
jgi:3-oxoacyl-[acyl-carrier protein] reductase